MPQPLPSKEQSLFRQVVKSYETKQYKKGIKAADQILRKFPDHADTQAMKALILNSQSKTDEAFVLAKQALTKDMKSGICWHVYGLLYRHVKNYEESLKAYKFALRLDPDSQNILRDLAQLQVHVRDYQGYITSRTQLLKQRASLRQNWTALAVAHHLAGDLGEAEKILETYEDTLKSTPSRGDTEHSEAQLYKNSIIAESGDTERALTHLESIYRTNLDRTAVMELRAEYLLKLGRKEEAVKAWRALVERNNEYRPYYEGLEKALGLDRTNSSQHQELIELYDSYAQKSVRLDAARRIPLDFLEGDDFKKAVDEYLIRMLTKGVPSTFTNIKMLYSNPSKKKIIEDLVTNYSPEKQLNGSADANGDASSKFEKALIYFLAQHYDYHLSRDLDKAQEYIEKGLALDAKSVDLNRTKGRILKHRGDTAAASKQMNHAREQDLKDRYINTKCAKYQLRNNENEAALKTMSCFTRNETVGGPLGDLYDMQCMWFLTEDGEAYHRRGVLNLALKRYKAIFDIFDVWDDDQYDFHTFSLRKGQIRAYIDMVRWEDRLRDHPFFTRVALSAIKIYLRLADDPKLAKGESESETQAQKNAKKKAKKEREKTEKEEAAKREAERKSGKKSTGADGEPKKEDADPDGTTLLETKTPLDEAMKYLRPLLDFSPQNIEGQFAGFEVFIRRKKYLPALRTLLLSSSLSPQHPTVHYQTLLLRHTLDTLPTPLPPTIAQVITSQFTLLPSGVADLTAYNDKWLSEHKESPEHVRAALKARRALREAAQTLCEKEMVKTVDLEKAGVEDVHAAIEVLEGWGSKASVKEELLEKASTRWPGVTAFQKA